MGVITVITLPALPSPAIRVITCSLTFGLSLSHVTFCALMRGHAVVASGRPSGPTILVQPLPRSWDRNTRPSRQLQKTEDSRLRTWNDSLISTEYCGLALQTRSVSAKCTDVLPYLSMLCPEEMRHSGPGEPGQLPCARAIFRFLTLGIRVQGPQEVDQHDSLMNAPA
jgi:hypothetical protein